MCGTSTKICVSCGAALSTDKFYRYKKNSGGLRHSCKECMKKGNKKWREANKDKAREYVKKWESANREMANEIRRDWRKKNRALVRQYESKWAGKNSNASRQKSIRSTNKAILTLSDSYVRDCLGLTKDIAPPALIDAHREYLKIKRFIQEKK